MSDEHPQPGNGPAEAPEPVDTELADAITRERPVPSARFRGALGRHLRAIDPGYSPRPVRLRATVAAYVAVGALLMLLGLLQATGSL